MKVEIEWTSNEAEVWRSSGCLYAYLHPRTGEILFIGKAGNSTVKQSFEAPDQCDLFEYFQAILRLDSKDLSVIVGEVILEDGRRLTKELLADIQKVLSKRVKPPGNIQDNNNEVSRPGMVVSCTGEWPHNRKLFVDSDKPF